MHLNLQQLGAFPCVMEASMKSVKHKQYHGRPTHHEKRPAASKLQPLHTVKKRPNLVWIYIVRAPKDESLLDLLEHGSQNEVCFLFVCMIWCSGALNLQQLGALPCVMEAHMKSVEHKQYHGRPTHHEKRPAASKLQPCTMVKKVQSRFVCLFNSGFRPLVQLCMLTWTQLQNPKNNYPVMESVEDSMKIDSMMDNPLIMRNNRRLPS